MSLFVTYHTGIYFLAECAAGAVIQKLSLFRVLIILRLCGINVFAVIKILICKSIFLSVFIHWLKQEANMEEPEATFDSRKIL